MHTLALAAMAGLTDGKEEPSTAIAGVTPGVIAGVLAEARTGDLAAFEALMRQHERLVLVTALRLTGSLPDAQDVSQEVFLKLYRNLGKLAGEGALTPWLYRVTVNACHDLRRRRHIRVRECKRPAEAVRETPSAAPDAR